MALTGEDDPDYDSSEEEFEDPAERFRHVGQRSIQAMLSAPFTRAQSKKWFKELVQGGTWHERYCLWLWYNRLRAYRTEVLRLCATSVPTSEDIIRFAVHFAKGRHGHGKSGVLNYDTMRHGLNYINKSLIFRHEEYTLGAHGASKIQAAMDTLLQDGDLTREMTRSREPAGAIVVRRLVMCLLRDAITKGTNSWDSVINDIAILILTSCFNCRGGDLMGDSEKTKDKRADLPGLRYSDLQFCLGSSGTLSDLKAKNRMRSAKGMKDDEKKYFHLFRNSLPEGSHNIMCPIKVILILALRSGNVYGQSIEDVLEHTRNRVDRTIQWRYPDRPVLCGSIVTNGVLDWDQLALRGRGHRAIVRANNILGSSKKITLHNLRFGAAEDLQVIHPDAPAGVSLDAISNELGHHPVGRLKGVGLVYTQTYSTEDHWAKRVELEPEQLPFNKFVSVTDPSSHSSATLSLESLRRHRSEAQVTKDCEDRGLDASVATNRKYRSRQTKATDVVESETSFFPDQVANPPIDTTLLDATAGSISHEALPVQPPASKQGTSIPVAVRSGADPEAISAFTLLKSSLNRGNIQADSATQEALSQIWEAIQKENTGHEIEDMDLVPVGYNDSLETGFSQSTELRAAWVAAQPSEDTIEEEQEFSTERALTLSDIGPNGVIVDDHATEAIHALLGEDDTVEAIDTIAAWDKSLLAALTGKATEYVQRMSSINVLRIASTRSKRWKAAVAAGNDTTKSVDVPSRFTFKCLHHARGCLYDTAVQLSNLATHLETCQFDLPQNDDSTLQDRKRTRDLDDESEVDTGPKKKKKAFKCNEPGCDKAYSNKGELTGHHNDDHRPVQCFIVGCDDDTTFLGEKKLHRDHMIPEHPALGRLHATIPDQSTASFKCPVQDDCSTEFRFFVSRTWAAVTFQKHARKVHGITDKATLQQLIPSFPGNPCFVPGCTSTELFPVTREGEEAYIRHLKHDHGITDSIERYEYLWKRVREIVMPLRHTDQDED